MAPNVYEDLYPNEEPPKDESIPGNEQASTPGKLQMEIPASQPDNMMSVDGANKKPLQQMSVRDEDITIGGNEIVSRGASDIIFRTYKPIQVLDYYGKNHGWNITHDMRTNAQ